MDSLNAASLGIDSTLASFFSTSATVHGDFGTPEGSLSEFVGSLGYVAQDIAGILGS